MPEWLDNAGSASLVLVAVVLVIRELAPLIRKSDGGAIEKLREEDDVRNVNQALVRISERLLSIENAVESARRDGERQANTLREDVSRARATGHAMRDMLRDTLPTLSLKVNATRTAVDGLAKIVRGS